MYLEVLYPCLVIMSTKKHNNYFIFAGTPKRRKQKAVHLCGLLVFATNTASPAVGGGRGMVCCTQPTTTQLQIACPQGYQQFTGLLA